MHSNVQKRILPSVRYWSRRRLISDRFPLWKTGFGYSDRPRSRSISHGRQNSFMAIWIHILDRLKNICRFLDNLFALKQLTFRNPGYITAATLVQSLTTLPFLFNLAQGSLEYGSGWLFKLRICQIPLQWTLLTPSRMQLFSIRSSVSQIGNLIGDGQLPLGQITAYHYLRLTSRRTTDSISSFYLS